MNKVISKFMTVAGVVTCMLGSAVSANANTFVYHDPTYDFSVSFPDEWRLQTPDDATTQIKISEPTGESLAYCQVKAQNDGRLLIHPERHMEMAVNATLDEDFWLDEFKSYDAIKPLKFKATSALGLGRATFVRVFYDHPFEKNMNDEPVLMQAVMLGSIYGDTRYVFSCAARADEFSHFMPVFGNVMDSVWMKPKYHPLDIGFYRDFLSD